ncbi:hypothetical protein ACHQM5_022812 [Ranunculus cassubicifolius]
MSIVLANGTLNCGSCGYALNLCSSKRNTSGISSKYGKSMKKGIISFLSIDESRFTQMDEYKCIPYFVSKDSWGLFRKRTKLLCRKCGKRMGTAYEENLSLDSKGGSDISDSSKGESPTLRKYDIRIRALQPSFEELGVPLYD